MITESRWFWHTTAAAAAVGTACLAMWFGKAPRPQISLPELHAESGTVFAEEQQVQRPLTGSAVPPLPETTYLLKLSENTLSVYEEGKPEAVASYELPAGWLPDYDRILLEYGMEVQGETALRALIEDYVS
ncbi:MAG TPA: hypothetical protein DCG49_07820 [Ruminococcus sp.]|nr:hypothetical protein [Ruminococcus sp.]